MGGPEDLPTLEVVSLRSPYWKGGWSTAGSLMVYCEDAPQDDVVDSISSAAYCIFLTYNWKFVLLK